MADVDLPLQVVREHVRSAVDLVVHLERGSQGQRRVQSIYRCGHDEGWAMQDGEFLGVTSTGDGVHV
jgi:Flp pilus assembly CpaF family ATPase